MSQLRYAVDFQRQNLGHDGVFIAAKGIHEWIGDPEEGVAKVLRVWYRLKTAKECRALEILARFAIEWRENFYRPGGRFLNPLPRKDLIKERRRKNDFLQACTTTFDTMFR